MFAVHNSKDKDDRVIAHIHYNLARCFMMNDKKRDSNKALFHANKSLLMRKRIFVDETHQLVVASKKLVEEIEAMLSTETKNAK